MAHYDDLNTKRIFTVGAISVLVTVMTALAVQVLYFAMAQSQAATRAEGHYSRQNEFLESQSAQISAYGVDETTGNITIPIEKAIELTVADKSTLKDTETSTSEGDENDEA
ncbi:hypothetical protein CA13_24190 [Planctomycetes bacterium CA13]|uniref:Uncharacterized protein n=1 Tax=Novipirellula herctigrandis TaxID=2527986 RepID=A0A5C5Z0R9_9BACT|nr:hypothetical protein CA13_24190 [Planctomycetes bacterium CA13]